MKRKDITGQRFGRLTAIRFDHYHTYPCGSKKAHWLFKCDCGKEVVCEMSCVTSGNTSSCGCFHKEDLVRRLTKHGLTNNRILTIWKNMKQRCSNPNNNAYKDYGGRGISICEEWLNDFMNFYNWAMNNGYEENLTIDRINVDGNYEPSNCRWADRKTQNRNTRKNKIIEINGEQHIMKEWAEKLNINYSVFKYYVRQNKLNKILPTWNIEGKV